MDGSEAVSVTRVTSAFVSLTGQHGTLRAPFQGCQLECSISSSLPSRCHEPPRWPVHTIPCPSGCRNTLNIDPDLPENFVFMGAATETILAHAGSDENRAGFLPSPQPITISPTPSLGTLPERYKKQPKIIRTTEDGQGTNHIPAFEPSLEAAAESRLWEKKMILTLGMRASICVLGGRD